jgi:hypothetical protein
VISAVRASMDGPFSPWALKMYQNLAAFGHPLPPVPVKE